MRSWEIVKIWEKSQNWQKCHSCEIKGKNFRKGYKMVEMMIKGRNDDKIYNVNYEQVTTIKNAKLWKKDKMIFILRTKSVLSNKCLSVLIVNCLCIFAINDTWSNILYLI